LTIVYSEKVGGYEINTLGVKIVIECLNR